MSSLPVGVSGVGDRGFLSAQAKLLKEKNISLFVPRPKKKKKGGKKGAKKGADGFSLSISEVQDAETISRERIHVERQMKRVKAWRFFHQTIPIDHKDIVGDAFLVCAKISDIYGPPLCASEERQKERYEIFEVATLVK